MWLGWGRHPTGSESGKRGVEFMQETDPELPARTLAEPWALIAGLSPYLESAKADVEPREDRVPAVRRDRDGAGLPGDEPRSAAGPGSVRHGRTLPGPEGRDGQQRADDAPACRGPSTSSRAAWQLPSKARAEADVLGDLAGRLYPDQAAAHRAGLRAAAAQRMPAPIREPSSIALDGNDRRERTRAGPGRSDDSSFPIRITLCAS